MPAHGEAGNEGQKNLPASPQAMQQDQGRAVIFAFRIVERDFPGVERLLFQAMMMITVRLGHSAAPAS